MTMTGGRSDDAGVTLLEMLVVLAILALVAVLSLPSPPRVRGDLGLRGLIAELAGAARSEHARAMRTSSERALYLDVARRVFWSEGNAPKAIAARYQLSVNVVPSERLDDSTARVRFFADGASSGAVLSVRDGAVTAALTIDWLTGTTTIAWGR